MAAPSMAALVQLQQHFDSTGNELGVVMALRELGTRQRDNSMYAEALQSHDRSFTLAQELGDTSEIIKALNNIGTDYRRLSKYEQATQYHACALRMSEAVEWDCYDAQKNRNMSYSGLGSVYLEIGNYQRSDSLFRMALQGEHKIGNDRGQAMCYANLGKIYEWRGMVDSAAAYYHQSMHFNQLARDTVGLALCHVSLGSLLENHGMPDSAALYYEHAHQLMQSSGDQWHALAPLLALARLYVNSEQYGRATPLLEQAQTVAQRIKSVKHLAEINDIYYHMHKQQGQWHEALASLEQAERFTGSLVSMDKINQLQNISLSIERSQQARLTQEAQQRYENERTAHQVSIVLFGSIALLLAAGLGLLVYVMRMRARHARMVERMAQLREDFFTNITHEFRTPLTVILGLGQNFADDETLPATKRTDAKAIVRQGNYLLQLINQLLDIAKVKSAIGEPDWRHGDAAAHTAMVVENYQPYADSIGINLQYQGVRNLEIDFVPSYLTKVVGNLLSNALKYTANGGSIIVEMRDVPGNVLIKVADTGEGISPESVPHIFDLFYQSETDRKHVGTGVGLALVKQIVTLVGGSINVQSKLGQGTTFMVRLPKRHGTSHYQAPTGEESLAQQLPESGAVPDDTEAPDQAVRLLIIEDNADVARYIGSQLQADYSISYATDGQQGIAKAREIVPDLIITDLMMPGTYGFEVCRQVRADEVISHVPIIILTAKESDADRVRGIEAGADSYLVKPFNADVLQARVKQLLRQRQELRKKFSQNLVAGKEEMPEISDADQRFLTKTIDAVYALMSERNLSINTLAEKMCLSTRQLQRKIFALTGQLPAAYVQSIKMGRAKTLLDTKPDMSLEDVADRSGFDHYSGFYHAFKKTFGVTPTQYRRSKSIGDASATE